MLPIIVIFLVAIAFSYWSSTTWILRTSLKKRTPEEYLAEMERTKGTSKIVTIIVTGLFAVGALIFFIKLRNTSSFAASFDPDVQAQIGFWVIGLSLVGLFSGSLIGAMLSLPKLQTRLRERIAAS